MAIATLPPVIGEVPVNSGQLGRRPLPSGSHDGAAVDDAAPPRAAVPAGTVPSIGALEEAVADALGRQGGLAPVFAAAAVMKDAAEAPAAVRAAAEALLGLVLGGGAVDGAALQRALARSGLYHESGGGADLKGLLLALRGALAGWVATTGGAVDAAAARRQGRPPPAVPRRGARLDGEAAAVRPDDAPAAVARSLIADTDRALARLLLHQSASLPRGDAAPGVDADAPPGTVLQLPLAGPGGVSIAALRIERDPPDRERRPGDGPPGRSHRAELAFAVDPLGPVAVRVGLLPGRRVVVGIWCETPAAVERLDGEIAGLADALGAAGLAVAGVDLHLGRPPEHRAVPGHAPPHRLDVEL